MSKSHQSIAKSKTSAPTTPVPLPLQMRPFAPQQTEEDYEHQEEENFLARAMDSQLMDMPAVQRQEQEEEEEMLQRQELEEEEETLQRQPEEQEEEELPVQAKLTIGQPGDPYEQEADAMAAKVMAMPDSAVAQRPGMEGEQEEEELQMRPLVQRQVAPEEEEEMLLQARPQIQAKGAAPAVPGNFETNLAGHKGGGSPLSEETRAFMEPRFGADFSGVRVHETPDLANAIQAQAFTHGQDIYFNSGKYQPESSGGRELLAHELTHVVQQTNAQHSLRLQRDSDDKTIKNSSEGFNYVTQVKTLFEIFLLSKRQFGKFIYDPSWIEGVGQEKLKNSIRRKLKAEISRGKAGLEKLRDLAIYIEDINANDQKRKIWLRKAIRHYEKMVNIKAKPRASNITLEFIPDDTIGDDKFPMGTIKVYLKGKLVDEFDARGGKPGSKPDLHNPGRFFTPTPPGKYGVGEANSHVSKGARTDDGERVPPWTFSQIAWGTSLKDEDPLGGVLYKQGRKWLSTQNLEVPIDRETIVEAEKELGRPADIPREWDLNDFGAVAFRMWHRGRSSGKNPPRPLIHTSPRVEEQYSSGRPEKLGFSHGCIHIKPSDRVRMIKLGYLQKGVVIIVRGYGE